jgi:hypothetical protein
LQKMQIKERPKNAEIEAGTDPGAILDPEKATVSVVPPARPFLASEDARPTRSIDHGQTLASAVEPNGAR